MLLCHFSAQHPTPSTDQTRPHLGLSLLSQEGTESSCVPQIAAQVAFLPPVLVCSIVPPLLHSLRCFTQSRGFHHSPRSLSRSFPVSTQSKLQPATCPGALYLPSSHLNLWHKKSLLLEESLGSKVETRFVGDVTTRCREYTQSMILPQGSQPSACST